MNHRGCLVILLYNIIFVYLKNKRTALTQMKNIRKHKKSRRKNNSGKFFETDKERSLNPVLADDNAMRCHDFNKAFCVIISSLQG